MAPLLRQHAASPTNSLHAGLPGQGAAGAKGTSAAGGECGANNRCTPVRCMGGGSGCGAVVAVQEILLSSTAGQHVTGTSAQRFTRPHRLVSQSPPATHSAVHCATGAAVGAIAGADALPNGSSPGGRAARSGRARMRTDERQQLMGAPPHATRPCDRRSVRQRRRRGDAAQHATPEQTVPPRRYHSATTHGPRTAGAAVDVGRAGHVH